MSKKENSPEQPPATQDVFIATHTAKLPGTSLTVYAGRINGVGELVFGVLLADFSEALTGKRDRFHELAASKCLKPTLKVDLDSTIYPLQGVHDGTGNPRVITTEGIAFFSAELIEANAAGKLKRSPRLRGAVAQLALMQTRAAAEGWRVAICQAVGIDPHPKAEVPSVFEAQRLQLEQDRLALARDRLKLESYTIRSARRAENRERRAGAIEKARDDMYRNGAITAQQAKQMTEQAMMVRMGRGYKRLGSPTQPPPRAWLTFAQVAAQMGPGVHARTVGKIIDRLGYRIGGANGDPVVGKTGRFEERAPDDPTTTIQRWGCSPAVAEEVKGSLYPYLMEKPSRIRAYNTARKQAGLTPIDFSKLRLDLDKKGDNAGGTP